jgi:cardiolipin synthase A/B
MTGTAALGWLFAAYALLTGFYIVLENRRPQATFAWMLLFLAVPGVGLLVHVLFGRDRKAFSRQRELARQDLRANAAPLLGPLLARQDAEIDRLEGQSPVRRRLMQLVRRNSHSLLTTQHRVEIQQDAAAHYASLIEDLKGAERSVHLQYFIWADDPFTRKLKTLLVERANAGVEVRLLYDPVGSFFKLSRRYRRELREGGVHVAPASALWRLHTLSYRNHRKIAVVDGRVGYTGGMNIGQEHLDGGPHAASWRDTQLRIEGEGAAVLQAVFLVDWHNATGQDLFAKDHFPLLGGGSGPTATPIGDEASDAVVPVQILTSGPDSQWRAIRQLYFAMIVSAQARVRLQSPYFILDATIAEALTSAALSGVDVDVMVSAGNDGPNQAPIWAANTYMAEVAAAGARVHLYELGYLHAKTLCVDGEVCSVGSANLDIRSFSINYELNAVIYDAELARELEAAFERDLEGCRPFDPAEYEGRPIPVRLRDSVARLLSPLM